MRVRLADELAVLQRSAAAAAREEADGSRREKAEAAEAAARLQARVAELEAKVQELDEEVQAPAAATPCVAFACVDAAPAGIVQAWTCFNERMHVCRWTI